MRGTSAKLAAMRSLRSFTPLLFASLIAHAQAVPEPAPGLRIPNGSRPWALDQFESNKQLVPVHSSAVQANNHKGSNVAGGLLAGPFYKSKFTTELAGESARTVLHTGTPVFYVLFNQDPDQGQSQFAGWAVVHVVVDKDRRLLSTVKFTQLTGNAKRSDTQVDLEAETLPGGWLRLTPKAVLPPGEYALEPVMKQDNAYSLNVYDFRIDPAAPNDADAVTN